MILLKRIFFLNSEIKSILGALTLRSAKIYFNK